MEVALRERRRLGELPVAVAVAVRRLDLARRVEREPRVRTLAQHDAVRRAARDDHVVVRAERKPAEDGLHLARALVDEQDLVALAVAVEAVGVLGGLADPHLDVGVEHQDLAAEDRVALRLERDGVGQPVDVGVGHPLVELDRLELADLGDAARRVQVVEDRLVAGEALVAHHLLGQERPVLAELGMALGRQAAHRHVAHQRFPLAACSRSIASKRALKLPSPKPRAPWRSMISKKSVGLSPIGFVKIWSR